MALSVDGIVSGMDTTSLITKLVTAAAAPAKVMEDDVADLKKLSTSYDELSTSMTALKTALETIDSQAEMRAATGTSTDDTAVAVTTDGDAVPGRYAIQVTTLAAAEIEVSQGFAERATLGTVPEGTLNVTYGGTTTALTVDATNSSLAGLVTLINENITGVSAYIMDTGDATAPYRLVIAGLDTGATNTIEVDTSGLTGGTGTSPAFATTSAAADAALTVNGVAITHPDNDIDGVVDGITFNLNDVTTEPVTINVKTDVDKTVANITAFVDAYNAVRTYINTNRAYDSENEIKGEFVGESLVVNLMRTLQTKISSAYSTGATYQSLASIGFETQQDGKIELDTDILTKAIGAAPGEVSALFASGKGGFGDDLQEVLEMYMNEDDGIIATRKDAITEQTDRLEEDIEAFSDRMDAYEARLRKQFTAMEIALGKMQDAQAQLTALMPDTSSDD